MVRQLSTDVDRLAARIHKLSLKLDTPTPEQRLAMSRIRRLSTILRTTTRYRLEPPFSMQKDYPGPSDYY